MNYSVLMSVYDREKPEYLDRAIKSILSQTLLTDDFVIVEDGKLNQQLENVIRKYEANYPGIMHIIRRDKNMGLGYSLQEGVIACKNEIIARMDSDDYSCPDRCSKQMQLIESGYDLVGSNIDEFEDDIEKIVSTKHMPKTATDIMKYAKFRNPFNHPSVMFKKSAALKAGNYRTFYKLEDYDLWIRMLNKNIKSTNIQESLVRMRVNPAFFKRRGGKDNLKSHLKLKKTLLQNKQINIFEYLWGCFMMIVRAFCPSGLKSLLYKTVFRS